MSRRTTLRTGAIAGLMLLSAVSTTGCPGLPCECDPDTVSIPADGSWNLSDIQVADYYDGGDSDEWTWGEGSPWDDVIEGQVVMEGDVLSVVYRTDQGTFRVELEEN